MKLAFSTLGCPDWKWNEIYSTAKDLKFDGIEVRGVENELFVPKIKAFDDKHIDKSIEVMKNCDLEFSMLTSGISIGEDSKTALQDAKSYIDLANKLSAKYVRIMISSHPQPEDVDMDKAISLYTQMCKYGEDKNVIPLIETNGVLADSKEMLNFMQSIKSENKGVLWDIHHPFRFFTEQPKETYSKIGEYVRYIHVKDSIINDSNLEYRMMGYGDVPIFDTLKILKENGYNGYVSLEWVKRWNPDLEGAGIVFAHFMSYITFMIDRL